MKKYIAFAIVAVLALSAVSVMAEDESGVNRGPGNGFKAEREAFRESLQTSRDAFKAELAAKKEEWKTANLERKNDFWNKAKRMIGERFEAAVRNMERMQARVSALIDTLDGEGEDTDLAEESLGLSEDKLDEAKVIIEEIKNLIPENGEKITPEIFEEIKLKAREAKDLLKESHKNLKDAVKALKDLKEDDEDESENE